MLKNKEPLFYGVLLALSLVASCLTFNNAKNIESFDYDRQMTFENINFFGEVKYYEGVMPKKKNKKDLLVLLKNTELQYVVSNDYGHWRRFRYSKVGDSGHLLVTLPNKPFPFSRAGERERIDSILFYPSLCIKKSAAITDFRGNSTATIYIYELDPKNIHESHFITERADSVSAKQKASLFAFTDQFRKEAVHPAPVKLYKSIPIEPETLELFFRKQIMYY